MMALFPWNAGAMAAGQTGAMMAKQEPPRRRRSIFGDGPSMGIIRRDDGDPGTLLNTFLLGTEGVQGLRDGRMRRDLFGMRVRGEKMEQAQAERDLQRGQDRERLVEEYITTLPPEQQARARMAYAVDPEAFAEAMAEQMSGGGWQVGQGYSHTFRTRPDGTIEMGGELPLRPRAPVMGYTLPGNDGTIYTDQLPLDLME